MLAFINDKKVNFRPEFALEEPLATEEGIRNAL